MFANLHSRAFNNSSSASASPQHTTGTVEQQTRNNVTSASLITTTDSNTNIKRLSSYSNNQQWRILNLLRPTSDKEERKEISQSLLGQSIEPGIANKYMKAVEFDGIGRICSFKKNMSLSDLKTLKSAIITPLTKTNTKDERESARPGRDCLIQFIHLMENVKGEVAQELLQEARNEWMSGNFSDHAISDFFSRATRKLTAAPTLQNMVKNLSDSVIKTKELSQHNDNMYGRKFESEFVNILIKNPPAGTMDATSKIGQSLLYEFTNAYDIDDPATSAKLHELAQSISLRPWTTEVPDLQKFMEKPTYENFKYMLLNVNHGFDIMKIQYLVAKINKSLPSDSISWKDESARKYKLLLPIRSTRPFLWKDGDPVRNDDLGLRIKTKEYGTGLANHPDYEKHGSFESAQNMTYYRLHPELNEVPDPDKLSLRYGHNTVTGGAT